MARPFSTVVAGDGGMFKICGKCETPKTLSNFGKDAGRIDGLSPTCRECVTEKGKKYYSEHRDKVVASNKRWAKNNPEKVAAKRRRFREKNPGYDVQWRASNPDAKESSRLRSAKARKSPANKLANAISCGIRGSLVRGRKRGTKWESLVGYSRLDLRDHLEKQFKPGMSWANYGRGGWHVDHKIPRVVFNYETPDDIDFRRCWELSNLQPLWESDNCSKQARLERPFQPSLLIADNDNEFGTRKAA